MGIILYSIPRHDDPNVTARSVPATLQRPTRKPGVLGEKSRKLIDHKINNIDHWPSIISHDVKIID